MNSFMETLIESQKRAKREAIATVMRGFDLERCMLDLLHGLSHPDRDAGALSLGYALEGSAESDVAGGYRLELHGLPTAATATESAPYGTYATLRYGVGEGRPEGMLCGKLSMSKTKGGWMSSIDGERMRFDDPADAAADFVRRIQEVFAADVLDGDATFRITVGSRKLAADIYRSLAIAEASYDPARRSGKTTPDSIIPDAPKL